ncbi:Ig-like domain-containing protein [Paenibacillus qinlingensis]|uniref:Uncharacterized protein YjdB n=1 Tax=Paenibacillus qinlingensis TaxID=1837343 RepID=A0ABU1NQ26_9BACL|nr:Ig-like domain-containing protein [Paenibacillus qinlingensis]MDR6549122.1 uncharacterized protein YjdB [Paenibacillus qinlingensis]
MKSNRTSKMFVIMLAIMMVVSSLPFHMNTNANEPALPVYQASTGYSGVQGNQQWRYQYLPFDRTEYQDLPSFSGNNWWKGTNNWDWGKLTNTIVTPGSLADTARTFLVPETGNVTIAAAQSITINPETYGGARLKIMKNNTQLWPSTGDWQPIAANQPLDFPSVTASVYKGDRLYFVANSGQDHANGHDDIQWDPVISYTDILEAVSPTGVTLDQHALQLTVGQSASLQAAVLPSNASNQSLFWSSSNSQVATVVNGQVTALANGTATITVTTMDGSLTDTCTVTVTGFLPSFKASSGYSGVQGSNNWRYQYRTFNASVFSDLPSFAGNQWWKASGNWDWGLLTKTSVTPGSQSDTSRTFMAPESGTLTITAAQPITIHPDTYGGARLKIMKNDTQIWPASGEWQSLVAKQVITFSPLSVTVSKGDRLYFIANSGSDHLNGFDDMVWDPVLVYTEVVNSVSPTQVTLDQHDIQMNMDDTLTLHAVVAPSDVTNANVTWTSSNPQVAVVENGQVKALAQGTVTITVSTMDGGLSDSCTIVVVGSPSYRATWGFAGVQGENHWRYQYRAFGDEFFTDLPVFSGGNWWKTGNNWDWGKISGNEVTPGSQADTSRTFVAPDSGSLTVTAAQPITIHPNTYGGARLKLMKNDTQIWPVEGEWVSLAAKESITFPDFTVSVVKGDRLYFIANSGGDHANGFDDIQWEPVLKYTEVTETISPTQITLDKHQLQPGIGEKLTLHAVITPANVTNSALYWASSNPKVATVRNGLVTVIGPGTATITATTADGGLTDQCQITVDGSGAVNRSELLFMLTQTLKLPSVPYQGIFNDVASGTGYADDLQSAHDNALIDSHLIENGSLHPIAPITREEAASMLINGYNRAMPQDAVLGDISTLSDKDQIQAWAAAYVQADRKLGIVYPQDTYPTQFNPQGAVTRFEALDMMQRLVAVMDIQAIIASAVAEGKSQLVIPPNTYRISPKSGSTIIPISNAHNLEIIGDGVTVIGTTLTRMLEVSNSTNVTISGLTFNYDPLPFTQGHVKAIAPNLSYLDIELSAGYPRQLFSRLSIYDPVTKFQKHGINHLWGTTAAWNEDGTMRISLNGVGTNVNVGDPVSMAGGQAPGGAPHGITVGGSSGIVFRNVTEHTAPGFGFLEAGSEGGTVLDGFKLIPGPAPVGATETPLLTAVWDGIQFKTSYKGPIVENSVVRNAGDDSFSIQSGDYGVVKVQGDEIVIVMRDGSQGVKTGDRLRQFNSSPEAIVTSVEKVMKASVSMDPALLQKINEAADWTPWRFAEETYYKIKLDRPSPFQTEDFIFSPDRMGNGFVFRNNDIYSPGRGMLLKAGDGLIENNIFHGGDKAIIISPEVVTDSHAGAGNNLIIRNNTILETGYHHYMPWSDQAGAIGFAAGNVKSEKAFSHITIENNTFDGVNGLNLNLSNVKNVTVKNNQFLRTHLQEPGNNGADKGIDPSSVIWVNNAEDVTFVGNEIDRMGVFSSMAVNVRPDTSGITGADNGVSIVNSAALNKLSQAVLAVDAVSLQPGDGTIARVKGMLSSGVSTSLIGAKIAYSTSNALVAVVDAQGKITAVAKGSAQIFAAVTWNGVTVSSNKVTVHVVVPPSTAKPGQPVLSDTSGYAAGLKDGNYTVTMNMWWGNNGTEYKLFENGVLIQTQTLTDGAPAAQLAKFDVKGKVNGTYTYTAELTNTFGKTTSAPLVVSVTDAAPGKPVISHNNWDGDGTYQVTMNLWWGTNATEYRLYENGVLVDSKSLSAATPNAQTVTSLIAGRGIGLYEYRAELVNSAGITSSEKLKVTVTK